MNKKRTVSIALLLLLLVALPVSLIAIRQSTENRQRAQTRVNLNSEEEIENETSNNSDGTMGPSDHRHNFSTKLLPSLLGTLTLQVIDPPTGIPSKHPDNRNANPTVTNMPTRPPHPTSEQKGPSEPTGHQGEEGNPSVTSLVLTFSKAEVHLASLSTPESSRGPKPTDLKPTHAKGKEDENGHPSTKGVQGVDKWETLDIGEPKTLDLVELAKSGIPATLGITKIAAGRYTEIRLYIDAATAVLDNDKEVDLTIPGKNNIVRLTRSFEILPNENTKLLIDFDAAHSVVKANDTYILKPVIARFEKKEGK